jgi:hypothetical protein
MSEKVHFIQHRGKEILSIDFSGSSPDDMLRIMDEAKQVIGMRPPNSVRTLTNVTGAHINRQVSEIMKEYVQHNKAFVRAGAVVGLDGLKTVIFNFLNRFTGRSLKAIDDLDAAKSWLADI